MKGIGKTQGTSNGANKGTTKGAGIVARLSKAARAARAAAAGESGEGYVDVLIKILITVIIGGAVFGILQNTVPSLLESTIERITSIFTLA